MQEHDASIPQIASSVQAERCSWPLTKHFTRLCRINTPYDCPVTTINCVHISPASKCGPRKRFWSNVEFNCNSAQLVNFKIFFNAQFLLASERKANMLIPHLYQTILLHSLLFSPISTKPNITPNAKIAQTRSLNH